jgi:LacI family transcriptional regulator
VIGVLVPAAMQFQGQIARGIHDELVQHNYVAIQLLGEPAPVADEQKELQQIHRLVDRRVDGMIIWPADASVADMHFHEIWERQIPLVTVDRETTSHADHVATDEELGGKLAADHLLSLGHRHVAHMSYPSRPGSITRRREAFVRAFTKGGGEVEVISGEREQLNDVARQLLKLSPRPTAIFAATDIMAMKLYSAAAELGVRIPEDLSVVGYADLPFAEDMYPPLTTIRQDPVMMGRVAGRMLLDRILERVTSKAPQKVFLKPELVVRKSTSSV